MLQSIKEKGLLYWIVIALVVILIPMVVLFYISDPEVNENYNKKVISASDSVPTMAEQPKDTLKVSGILPIHSWNSNNGVKVIFVPTEKLPIIDIDVSFNAGSSRDGKNLGIANLTSDLLSQGLETMPDSSDEIALTFENAGANYSSEINKDRVKIKLRALSNSKDLDKLIDLYSDMISIPSFDAESINRIKDKTLVNIQYTEQLPNNIINKEFLKNAYGEHPYANPALGIIDTVKNLSYEDIKHFHSEYYVAENATITIVGGIHRDKAMAIANKISKKLPHGNKAKELPIVSELKNGVNKSIQHSVNQAKILIGRPGADINDPDKFALIVGNYILGSGPFTSRLFKEIRMDKGLAYSVYSDLAFMSKSGPFIATLETRTGQEQEALSLLKKIINDFIDGGPTEKELKYAKKHLVGSFPLNLGSNYKILEAASTIGFYNLPFDYLDTYVENIKAVNIDDIKSAFNKKLNQDNIVQVVLSAKT